MTLPWGRFHVGDLHFIHKALSRVSSSSTVGTAYYFIDCNSSQGSTNKTKTTLEYFKQRKTELIAQVLKELWGRVKTEATQLSKSSMPVLSLRWWGKGRKCGAKPQARITRGSWITAKNRSIVGDAAGGKEKQNKKILWFFFAFCHSLPLAGPDWKPATKEVGKQSLQVSTPQSWERIGISTEWLACIWRPDFM